MPVDLTTLENLASEFGDRGFKLPFKPSRNDIGAVLDSDGNDIFVVDVNNQPPDQQVADVAELITVCVNYAALVGGRAAGLADDRALDRQRYRFARQVSDEIEKRRGESIGPCEACGGPIFEDENWYRGPTIVCEECAPTIGMLLTDNEGFVDLVDEEPLGPIKCRALYDAHIAAGGKPTDSMAYPVRTEGEANAS